MYWHDIPSQIKATDENGTVKRMLPARFQQAIDSAAIAAGKSDSDAYLEGWQWSRRQERPGPAETVAEEVLAELDEAYAKERLRQMIMDHAKK